MNPGGLSDADLELLTDEERAGLESDDDGDESNDDGADDGAGEGDGGDGNDDDGDDADNEGADGAADNADDGKDADTGAQDDASQDDDDDDDTPSLRPTGDRIDVAASNTRLEAIAAEKDALETKLDDGELTTKEFRKAIDDLNKEGNDLSNAVASQTASDKAVSDAWYKDVNAFLGKHPDLKANDTRLRSFDEVVRRVTSDAQYAELSNRKQLAMAHDLWKRDMGIVDPAPANKKGDESAPTPKPKPKPAKELPPTLHNVPAADVNDADDGKYSFLDGLLNAGKVIEYENALAKLSDADQDEYLSRP